jgi:hypothetical protein
MLDDLRNAAKVTTCDEAAAICYKGIGQIEVSVINNLKDEGIIWAMDGKTKKNSGCRNRIWISYKTGLRTTFPANG